MIQSEFFKNSRFSPFYSNFKIKSSENSCKNNIFFILFKIDFKYTKRRDILMQLVPDQYDYQVTHNCNFSDQNRQRCQEICKCNNFHLYDKWTQVLTENGVFHLSKVI